MCSRLESKFGAQVELSTPSVPYRETITGTAKVEGKHKNNLVVVVNMGMSGLKSPWFQ